MSSDILTFSCGTLSTNILAHILNNEEIQLLYEHNNKDSQEIDFNCTFDITSVDKLQYVPRVILLDNKDNYKFSVEDVSCVESNLMKQYGNIVSTRDTRFRKKFNQAKMNWVQKGQSNGGNYDEHFDIPQKRFYSSQDNITSWSDFLHPKLHPRSLLPIDTTCGSSNDMKLNNLEENFEEAVRYFAERSNRLQGFHHLFDISPEYLPAIHQTLEYVKDEFPKKSLHTFASFPWWRHKDTMGTRDFMGHIVSTSFLLQQIYPAIDCLYPLSMFDEPFDYPTYGRPDEHTLYDKNTIINLDRSNYYELSALYSLAIDSVTLPYRTLADPKFDMRDMTNFLTMEGQSNRIRSLSCRYYFDEDTTCDGLTDPFPLTPYDKSDDAPSTTAYRSFNVTRGFDTNAADDKCDVNVRGSWKTCTFNNALQLSPAFPWIFRKEESDQEPFRTLNTYNSTKVDLGTDVKFFEPLLKEARKAFKAGVTTCLEGEEIRESLEFLMKICE